MQWSTDDQADPRARRGGAIGAQARRTVAARGARELALFAAVYALYDAARWVFAGRLPAARADADWIVDLERSLHIAIEGSVQRALDRGVASWLLANVYLAAQLVVLPGALIWLYHRSPPVYRRLRNTVIGAWLLAVPIFALFPVAPPRLMDIGIADTVSRQAAVALTGHSTIFYNPYAAVPSLHVGLAFAIGIAAHAALRARWAKALALTWGPLVVVAVVATGNHYVFDVVAGLLVTGLAHAATRLPRRLLLSRRRLDTSCALGRGTRRRRARRGSTGRRPPRGSAPASSGCDSSAPGPLFALHPATYAQRRTSNTGAQTDDRSTPTLDHGYR